MKKLNKNFKIIRVIIIVRNDYFIIRKLFMIIKGFILYQIKQTALKSGNSFTTSSKFTDTIYFEVLLQSRKPVSPIWATSSRSTKRQATGFEPLRHRWLLNKRVNYGMYETDDEAGFNKRD